MFGYVRLHKPEIKMGEYEQYQGVYCTLCRRLGKHYGPGARITLSYDMTFLALLDMAMEPEGPDFCPGHCSFNPTKKCLRARNTRATDKAAHIGTLLSYYKIKDTLADEGFIKRLGAGLALLFAAPARRKAARLLPDTDRAIAAHIGTLLSYYKIKDTLADEGFIKRLGAGLALLFAAPARRKAARLLPDTNRAIAAMMADQAALERAGTTSIDRAAEPFAKLLEALAADLDDHPRQRQILTRFGYCLGRWIYLMDAVDDLAEDLKKGRYNPYAAARGLQPGDEVGVRETREYAGLTLNACLAECTAAYNLLDIRRFDGILRNILELGMPAAQRRVIAGEERS